MNKTIIHDKEVRQITVLDNRYYYTTGDNRPFPSVTTILDIYPKGFGFYQWMKDVGNNASDVLERAARAGSNVHNAIDLLNKGHKIDWINEKGEGNYVLEEWEMILKYKQAIDQAKIRILYNELSLCSPELGYGGTIDLVCEIGGKRWLIDVKTSNNIYTTHELQVAAYTKLFEAERKEKIDRVGILWLKASTRTEKVDYVKQIYQGVGWQIKTFERSHEEAFKIFNFTHNIWKEENPVWKPLNEIYPDSIKLTL
jgi:hypothetical protein